MLEAVLPTLFLLLIALVIFSGAITIASGGFIRMAAGALLVALCLSLFFSSCASVLLEASSTLPQDTLIVSFMRSTLGAMAQPTISGIALLSILVVGASTAARLSGLVEDIQILLDAHKAVIGEKSSYTTSPMAKS